MTTTELTPLDKFVNVLKGFNSPELAPIITSLTIPADKFSFRWQAE